jgi:acetyl-CoA/propionyl-CoA carboxylase carboxyl transferase subunit
MSTQEVDPRDPQLRIARLLDPNTTQLITPRDESGMIAATGSIKGNKVIVFASDATIKSGALGVAGVTTTSNYRYLALRWCTVK